MNRNKSIIALCSIVVIIIVAATFYLRGKTPIGQPTQTATSILVASTSLISNPTLTTASSVPVFPHDVKYLADGTVDTSDWSEFKSEYGGFSVRAPKSDSSIGCYGHGCEPARDGEAFFYSILPPEEGPGLDGMSVYVIKKIQGTTLDAWIKTYVVSGKENVYSVEKTTIQGHSALQFDTHISSKDSFTFIKEAVYPSGPDNEGNIAGLPGMNIRHYIIDAVDHYIVLSYTTNIDSNVFLSSLPYVAPLYPKSFDNKALADIYKTIFDSLVIFTPTKK